MDITDGGFDALGGVVSAVIPAAIEIPDMSDGGTVLCDYWYSLSDAWVSLEVTGTSITPGTAEDTLSISVDLLIWLNDASDPFTMIFGYDCTLLDSESVCLGHVQPFPATATMDLTLEILYDTQGDPSGLDATISNLAINYDLEGDDIILEDCGLATIEEILSWLSLSLYDWIIGFADSYIQDEITSMAAEIEAAIEDAFSAAIIHEEFELMEGVVLEVDLYPNDIQVDQDGMRIVLGGSMDALGDADACIAEFDPGGSTETTSALPTLGAVPSGISEGYHADLLLGDDIANQALYSLWRTGLLCYTLDENFTAFEISTSVLALMGTDAFDPLFPDPAPMAIVTRPRQVPLVDYNSSNDIDLTVTELGLDFYAELDGRQALILGLNLDARLGANLNMDGSTGLLGIDLDIDPANILATVRSNEIVPDATNDIESGFGGLLETILGMFLGDSLQGLSFQIPGYEGIGLTDLQVAPTGADKDWMGAYAWVGEVPYESTGCSDGGGCDSGGSSGCESGCGSLGNAQLRWMWLPLGGMAVLLRRRRED